MNFLKTFGASLLAWIVGVILVFVFLIGSLINSIVSSLDTNEGVSSNTILCIDLNENIIDAPISSIFGSVSSLGSLTMDIPITLVNALSAIEKAASDPNIKGICIKIDGLGVVSLANIEELREALLRFKESGKFIVAYDGTYSQSDYYLASVADEVIINPEGMLEWYGVGMTNMFYKRLLDKLDISVEILRPASCKFKSAVEPFFLDKMSEANRQQNQALVDSIWDNICSDIAESRELSAESLKQYAAQLAVSLPEEALKLGMVDSVAPEDYLYALYDNYGVERNEFGLHNTLSLGEYITNSGIGLPTASVDVANSLSYSSTPLVAIIYAEGQIYDGNMYEDNAVYGSRLASELRQARLDDNTKAVVLRVNSPGGSALASEFAWREMVLLQQTKPVVVSMGDMAASGGYYISTPADYIFADKNTLTGSIGVFGMIPNLGSFLSNHIGITIDSATTSPQANMTGLEPLTPLQRKMLNKQVDRVYNTFTSHVAEGRNLDIDDVYKVAEGRVWSGTMAEERGLVDAIGGLNAAIAKALELADITEQHQLYEFTAPLTPFDEWIMSAGMVYAKHWGLDYNIYGDTINKAIKEIPMVFTYQGVQMVVVGDPKIIF